MVRTYILVDGIDNTNLVKEYLMHTKIKNTVVPLDKYAADHIERVPQNVKDIDNFMDMIKTDDTIVYCGDNKETIKKLQTLKNNKVYIDSDFVKINDGSKIKKHDISEIKWNKIIYTNINKHTVDKGKNPFIMKVMRDSYHLKGKATSDNKAIFIPKIVNGRVGNESIKILCSLINSSDWKLVDKVDLYIYPNRLDDMHSIQDICNIKSDKEIDLITTELNINDIISNYKYVGSMVNQISQILMLSGRQIYTNIDNNYYIQDKPIYHHKRAVYKFVTPKEASSVLDLLIVKFLGLEEIYKDKININVNN